MRKKYIVVTLIVALLISLAALVLVSCADDTGKFTVTFVADGQTVATVQCKQNATTVKMPDVPGKYGYEGHWEPFSLNGNDLTVQAVYEPKQYTVVFDYDNAEYKPVQQAIFAFDSAVGSLPETLKSNNYFVGWFWRDLRITSDYVWETDVEDTIVLTAKWIPSLQAINYQFKTDLNAYCVVSVDRNSTEVVVPSSYNGYPVAAISSQAFAYCLNLKSVLIPHSVSSIGNVALFAYSDSIESITIHPDNQYYYSEGNCIISKATNKLIAGTCSSVIPSGVKTIGKFAFGKVGFSTFTIPDGVEYIEEVAFVGCVELTSVFIPASVRSIVTSAFYQCTQLTTIYFGGTFDQWNQLDKYGYFFRVNTSLERVICLG
ncbi:MAG: leucine-rich repeat domain-containing protein [Clostridiales bacterium]|nr:leucine-rich repeat domain-containing protein [Clostridiales bacterium]